MADGFYHKFEFLNVQIIVVIVIEHFEELIKVKLPILILSHAE